MANKLKFSRGLENNLPAPVDGTVRFCTDTGSLYIDNKNEHKKISAEKADYLATKRKITLTGSVNGEIEFDGSEDVTMNTTSGLDSTQLIENSELAYSKNLPVTNVSNYGTITEIGGMSYKCNNLCPITKTVRTINGYVMTPNKDGSITVTGAATNDKDNVIPFMSYSTDGLYVDLKPGVKYSFSAIKTNNIALGCKIDYTDAQGGSVYGWHNQDIARPRRLVMVYIQTSSTAIGIGDTSLCGTYKVMINEGETVLPYEPYFEGLRDAKVTSIKSEGRSLFPASEVYGSWATEMIKDSRNCYRFVTNTDRRFAPITFKENTQYTMRFDVCAVQTQTGANPSDRPLIIFYTDGTSTVTSVGVDGVWKTKTVTSTAGKTVKYIGLVSYEYRIHNYIDIDSFIFVEGTEIPEGTKPYFKNTFAIPEEVQALEEYGLGINANYYNKIIFDATGNKAKYLKCVAKNCLGKYTYTKLGTTRVYFAASALGMKKGSTVGLSNIKFTADYNTMTNYEGEIIGAMSEGTVYVKNPNFANMTDAEIKEYLNGIWLVYELATSTETDVTEYFTQDNLIKIEAGGTVTAVNEYGYGVPFTINYSYGKNYDVISSKKFIGDLDGIATRAISDGNGKIITNTYLLKENGITDLTIDGKTITYTKGDGTKGTLTTQDTIQSIATSTKAGIIKSGGDIEVDPTTGAVTVKKAENATMANSATTAAQLTTERTIALDTAVTSTATSFNGSKDISIPVTGIKEAYLTWGGKNRSGGFGPVDAAMVPELGANRLAFMPAEGITFEYSRDGGTTWLTYDTTDTNKINFFNGNGVGHRIGASSDKKIDKSSYMLRVTIETSTAQVYTTLNKFVILCSTEGSTGCYCTITARTQANYTSGTDTWSTFADKVGLSGWSGYNVININSLTTYGNQTTHYRQVRFTFGVTSHASTVNHAGLSISKIMGFGGVGHTTPSTMAKNGRIYTYSADKSVTFPAKVTATTFVGNLSGNASTATKATKLGDSTIGSTSQPIYLNAGTATKISAVGTAYGGTGATTVAEARTNLEVYSKTEVDDKLTEKSSTTHRHTVAHTPVGTISQPTFTGSEVDSGTPSETTSVYSITGVGSVPSLTTSVSNGCLVFSWKAGSVPTRSSVAVASSNHKHKVTASGTVSKPTFTGTAATLTTSTPI